MECRASANCGKRSLIKSCGRALRSTANFAMPPDQVRFHNAIVLTLIAVNDLLNAIVQAKRR